MAVSTRQALFAGTFRCRRQLCFRPAAGRDPRREPRCRAQGRCGPHGQGYALEAAPRRGYRLAGGDPFCTEAIGDYPAPIYLYDTLESSNRTAKLLALDGAPHGTLVLTATRAPDAAGWAENLKARQARAFTARCCCARKCPPPMPRPLPSAQLWRSAVP